MVRKTAGTAFAVFVLFFGIALIDAIRNREWPMVVVYVILGVLFLRADSRGVSTKENSASTV